jgi:CheY-like chemotaxis protein
MEGQVTVESELGKGSRFEVRLPLGMPDSAADTPTRPPAKLPEGGLKGVFRDVPARILVVEDNATNQEVAVAVLNRFGLDVDTVPGGKEALDRISIETYDLILMDVQMPGMDGYEVTRRLRAGEAGDAGRSVPIVAMTAHALDHDRDLALQSGMNDYITKPVNPRELARVLGSFLLPEHESREREDQVLPTEETDVNVPLDRDGLLDRLLGDHEMMLRVLEDFAGRFRQDLMEVHRLQVRDPEGIHAVRRYAHRIKGTAANINALELQAAASNLETCAEPEIGKSLTALMKAGERLLAELSNIKQEKRNGYFNR